MATVAGADEAGRRGFAELLAQQATPEGVRDNPFRVIGLPTDASSRDLRRRAEQIRRDPDVPAAEVERVEAALRRLRDPVQRLIDELLWHWPDEAGPRPGHEAAIGMLQRFVEADTTNPADTGLRKLQDERGTVRYVEPDAAGAGEGEAVDLVELCGLAVGTMAAALTASPNATYLAARAEALDDPRVSADDARRLVEEAHLVVPLVALRMAARLHGTGQAALATGLARAVRANTGAGVARDAAAKVLEPAVGRVRALVEAAERASRHDPAQGATRAANLLEQTGADRALGDALLDDDDPVRAGMVDRIVDQVFDDVIASYNETRDDGTATALLQQAKALRPSSVAQARIDENLEIVRENAQFRQCWFCQAAPADPDAAFEVDLYGNVERDHWAGRVTWSNLKLAVPRCPGCAASDQRREKVGCWIGAGLPVLAGGLSGAAGAAGLLHPVAMVAIWALILVAAFVMALVMANPRSRRRLLQFPPLQEKLAGGWKFGARPPETQ